MSKLLIFTDLDGTLLNHEDYSYKDAIPALEIIKKKKIPLIVVSSKTRAEIQNLLNELGFDEPFIVENGAAVFFPERYKKYLKDCEEKENYCVIKLGEDYAYIRSIFSKLKRKFPVKGFGDITVEEVAKLTGLSIEKAKLAKQREYTEPFIIENIALLPDLEKEAEKYNLKITKGGRFFHLIGKNQDKGKAVRETEKVYMSIYRDIKTVGLGDSKNDIPMLKAVDIPVLIRKSHGSYENLKINNLVKSTYPGSKGWNEIILKILSVYD